MARKTNKDVERKGVEYRFVWLDGYRKCLKDNMMNVSEMTKAIIQIGDPKVVAKVEKWAAEEEAKRQGDKALEKMTKHMLCSMCIHNKEEGRGECIGTEKDCLKWYNKYRKSMGRKPVHLGSER